MPGGTARPCASVPFHETDRSAAGTHSDTSVVTRCPVTSTTERSACDGVGVRNLISKLPPKDGLGRTEMSDRDGTSFPSGTLSCICVGRSDAIQSPPSELSYTIWVPSGDQEWYL